MRRRARSQCCTFAPAAGSGSISRDGFNSGAQFRGVLVAAIREPRKRKTSMYCFWGQVCPTRKRKANAQWMSVFMLHDLDRGSNVGAAIET